MLVLQCYEGHPKNLDNKALKSENDFALRDIAPTVLYLLGVEKHEQMSGSTIFSE